MPQGKNKTLLTSHVEKAPGAAEQSRCARIAPEAEHKRFGLRRCKPVAFQLQPAPPLTARRSSWVNATDTAEKPSRIESASVCSERCVQSREPREPQQDPAPQRLPNRRMWQLLQTRCREAFQSKAGQTKTGATEALAAAPSLKREEGEGDAMTASHKKSRGCSRGWRECWLNSEEAQNRPRVRDLSIGIAAPMPR